MKSNFILIDFDGWNVGLMDFFEETRLEFNTFEEAYEIAVHWDLWIYGEENDRS